MARDIVVDMQAPLPAPSLQKEVLDAPERFKVLRWGRRTGKTRTGFIAATMGHGSQPNGKGLFTGGDVLWIARDYPNSDTIWRKEIMRRFGNKEPAFKINKQHMRVEFVKSGGVLTVVSAENIDSVRGGDWDGVHVSEGAHMDLDYVWHDVVRPGLADSIGWAVIESTTKPGSYFNSLCERVMANELVGWRHWHSTAFDNPKIDDDEIRAMIAEYHDEVKLKCEVFAELVVPGGLAFGEWRTDVHVHDWDPPVSWNWIGTMDWGFVNPGVFYLVALGPDQEKYFRWEFYFQGMEPKEVGYQIGKSLLGRGFTIPAYILCDPQMFERDQSVITVGDKVQEGLSKALGEMAPGLTSWPKGPDSRITGKMVTHAGLKFTEPAEGEPLMPWHAPRVRFHSDCSNAIRTIPKLRRDEKNPEAVGKDQEDHPYDALKGLLLSQTPTPEKSEFPEQENFQRHPGFTASGRKKKYETLEMDEEVFTGYSSGLGELH